MAIIISIIVLVALVSLYDYFSARNWQQVTSSVRNEVVFEKRNKAYGAYAIRKDYNRRMILILSGLVGGVGVAYGAYMAAGSVPEVKNEARRSTDTDYDTIQITIEKKEVLPKIREVQATAPSRSDIVKFIAPTVTEEDTRDDLKLIDEDDLTGIKDQKGEERFGLPVVTTDSIPKKGILEETVIDDDNKIVIADEDPEYPGGRTKMYEFLSQNLVYPELPKEMGVEGKCWLRFVVDRDGSISNVIVTRGIDGYPEFGKESMRVIRKMPNWRPGRLNGSPVKSYFDMPINFVLKKD